MKKTPSTNGDTITNSCRKLNELLNQAVSKDHKLAKYRISGGWTQSDINHSKNTLLTNKEKKTFFLSNLPVLLENLLDNFKQTGHPC